jgi:hypothetical protein
MNPSACGGWAMGIGAVAGRYSPDREFVLSAIARDAARNRAASIRKLADGLTEWSAALVAHQKEAA